MADTLELKNLSPRTQETYCEVENLTLLPILLSGHYHQAIASEEGAEAATFRIETLAADPTLLGRPNHRKGGERYARALRRAKQPGFQRYDLEAFYRFCEGWLLVRHKLVPSLKHFVESQPVRPYNKPDDESPEFSTRYTNWQRELKKIDEVLEFTQWP